MTQHTKTHHERVMVCLFFGCHGLFVYLFVGVCVLIGYTNETNMTNKQPSNHDEKLNRRIDNRTRTTHTHKKNINQTMASN